MTSPLRLLITIPALSQIYGGPSKSVRELAQALGAQGAMVDLVTTNADGTEKLDVPLQEWLQETHYRVQYFPCWVWGDYKWSTRLTQWLKQSLTAYDAVHINAVFSLTNISFYRNCRRFQVPYIVAPRGMLEPWALAYKSSKKQLYYQIFEEPALNAANAIHALAGSEAQNIKCLGLNTSVITIPNGIHRKDFETLSSPELFYQRFPHIKDRTILLFLGRIDPKKGLDLLATAFTQVHSRFPNTHLVVAGPDNIGFLPIAQTFFKDAGCHQAVTFTGMLTGQIKSAALAAADLYIAPSYSEGFSMSVLEGMAAGLPCVITTGCNFPEAGMAQAAHVVDTNSEALARALILCLQDRSAAKVMGDRARQFVFEHYTWDIIASNLIQVYQSICRQKSTLEL